MKNTVQTGNTVSIHYKGTFDDGTVFDSSRERGEPMTVTVGDGSLISGFEAALSGMTLGEVKNISLTPDQAYGDRVQEAIQEVPKSSFPEGFEFNQGATVYGQTPDGNPFPAVIAEESDTTVTLDLNHPMAGKNLNFEIELVNLD